ncbi:bifunctional 5-dehydro-2-deoxygluconokinase/5-dehydro-2-deoxyphosphogluconate aldolase [Veronia pacifica]|uniref:5-dehydro-2-deoxygluconokinase n=1 Tax=Veronia pacifica TaxID=1080227 RepID=A0A1C3EMR2_9GAMM|nr:5-dehydro-2-deoxygluconokinase [Veronia pacifica]ODA34524.1 5-dehydro-2-deoxygluconokinase [Veronia pacifica]
MVGPEKTLDVICMGRVAVDLYGDQIGAKLEDMRTFSKYLGGSSGNLAYGTAIQGLRSGMLARVGDEHMGRFVREELERAGVDTQYLITDPDRLTGLVVLGIKDKDTFPLIFFRENCADMAISVDDISEEYIASSRCLAITGTHLSHPQTREAVLKALEYAKKHRVKTALDIDYRPVLWGLTSHGDGETRFIESGAVTTKLQQVLSLFDLIVGTEEEFHIAGGDTDTVAALKKVRMHTDAELVCKRGALGCSVFTDTIPNNLDQGVTVKGVRVDVLNVLGAGDAFMSGLLRGYLNGESWEKSCQYANACGALVVSRHGCSPAMPTREELDNYLARWEEVPRPDKDTQLNHLHRVTKREQKWQEVCVMAFDHRAQFVDMVNNADVSIEHIPYLKNLLWKAAKSGAASAGLRDNAGVLCDSTFGQDVLNQVTGLNDKNLGRFWVGRPVELPGSRPLRLEHGNIGTYLSRWPKEQIVKCLMFYHPDDKQSLCEEQENKIQEIYQACCHTGNEMLLEIVLPRDRTDLKADDEQYRRVVNRVYELGIKPDWWKLPPLKAAGWQQVDKLIDEYDPHCQGVVILGLDAPMSVLAEGFKETVSSRYVRGFAVGRTLFGEPSRQWLAAKIDDNELIEQVKNNYITMIDYWRKRKQ